MKISELKNKFGILSLAVSVLMWLMVLSFVKFPLFFIQFLKGSSAYFLFVLAQIVFIFLTIISVNFSVVSLRKKEIKALPIISILLVLPISFYLLSSFFTALKLIFK